MIGSTGFNYVLILLHYFRIGGVGLSRWNSLTHPCLFPSLDLLLLSDLLRHSSWYALIG